MQLVPNTTNVVSSNPAHCEVYLMQHNVIKFVSDLQQVIGFLWILQFPLPIKVTATKYAESGIKHHNTNPTLD